MQYIVHKYVMYRNKVYFVFKSYDKKDYNCSILKTNMTWIGIEYIFYGKKKERKMLK